MKTLYIDIISGISGDMSLSALLQFGIDIQKLNYHLSDLLKGNVELSLVEKKINGISTKQLKIKIDNCETPHRNLTSISKILKNSELPEKVINDSINIFKIIADSESKMHNQPKEKVHFHEVGAIDSIIDIVGISYCMNELSPNLILSSPAIIGNGIVNTAHGLLPVPAPATMDILKDIPLRKIEIDSELTTPTGAAFLKYYVKDFTREFEGQITDISYSTGTKEFKNYPNMLRLLLLNQDSYTPENIYILETNIDDDTGENLSNLMDLLFENNALDVFFTPIFMKKNRPAVKLSIMTVYKNIELFTKIILENSSSIGIRYYPIKRKIMDRTFKQIKIKNENIKIKVLNYDKITKYSPEWDSIVKAAKKLQIPPSKLYHQAITEIDKLKED